MATLSALSKLGFGLESTWGTAVVATTLLPVRNLKTVVADYKQELDDGVRGVAAKDFGAYQGTGQGSVEWEGDFYPEELGYFLKLIMGGAAVTGIGPYDHTFSLASNPASLTLEESILAKKWAGMVLSDLGLKFSAAEGKLTYTAKMVGKTAVDVTPAAVSDATVAPFLGWQASLQIGGAGNTRLLDLSLDFKRPVELLYTANNTKDPSAAAIGPLEVTGKATFDYDTTELGYYLSKTQNAFVATLGYGTGAGQKQLVFTGTKTDYGDGPVEIDRGKTYVTLAASLRFLHNTTDGGPCKITTLKNSKASYAT